MASKDGSKHSSSDGAAHDEAEVLAASIERTREDLAETVDAIADKVSPKRVAARTKSKVAEKVETVKEQAAQKGAQLKEKSATATAAVKDSASSAVDSAKDSATTAGTGLKDKVSTSSPAPTGVGGSTAVVDPRGATVTTGGPARIGGLPLARVEIVAAAAAAVAVVLVVLRRRR